MQSRLNVTSTGQLTLRREVMRHLGIKPGDSVVVEPTEPGRIELRAAPSGSIEDFFGMLKRPGQPVLTIEQINEAIAKGWAGEL